MEVSRRRRRWWMSEEYGIWDGGIPWISFSFQKSSCILMEIPITSVPRLGNHSQHTTPFLGKKSISPAPRRQYDKHIHRDSRWFSDIYVPPLRAQSQLTLTGGPSISEKESCISTASLLCVSCLWKISSGFSTLPGAGIGTKYLLTPLNSSNRLSYGRRWVCMMRSFQHWAQGLVNGIEKEIALSEKTWCPGGCSLFQYWDKVRRHRQINIFLNQLRRSNMSRAERVMSLGEFGKQWM